MIVENVMITGND